MKKLINEIFLQFFGDLLTNFGVSLEINTTPTSTATWVELGEGFDNLAEALNEIVQDYNFLNNGGYGESEVTGMQPMFTLTGVRKLQDTAQNYIFSKKYEILNERKTDLRLNYTKGDNTVANILFSNVTMANIVEYSGASADGSAISVEFKTSGKPQVTGADLLASLAVVSVAGSNAGETDIYVNPAKEGSNIYKYQLGTNLTLPTYGQDVSALTTWDGSAAISATTGQEIMIVEATSGNLARKGGIATVTTA